MKTITTTQSRLSGALMLSLAQVAVLAFGYVTHIIVSRELGPGPYGIYGVVLSIQTIAGLVLTLGVPAAISKYVAQTESQARSILATSLTIQTIIAAGVALATLIFAPVISRVLGDTNFTNYIIFIAGVLFFQAFYPVYNQFLSGMHRFNAQAGLTTLYAVAKLAGAVGLLYIFREQGVYGAFAGFAVGGIVAGIIGWYITRNIGGTEKSSLPVKSFLAFAGMYVVTLIGLQIVMSLDLFMVKAILKDDVSAGYYNAASTLARIPYFLLQALSFILLPSVAKLTKPGESRKEAVQFIADVLRYLIALIVPSVAFAAATSKALVRLFYSTDYIPAAPVLTVLIVGLGALAFYLLLANITAGAGKTKVTIAITALIIVISFISGRVFIPLYGLIGAAYHTTLASLIGFALLAIYTFRVFGIKAPVRSIVNIIVASAVAVAPTYIWKVAPILLPLQYVVLYVIYAVVLLLLKEITQKDTAHLKSAHPLFAKILK